LTPTEIYNAWQSGADVVKVFPCGAVGGASYIKAVKSVFPEIKLMPTGGVQAASVKDYLNGGAFAVGVGSDIIDWKALRDGRKVEVIDRTRQLLALLDTK